MKTISLLSHAARRSHERRGNDALRVASRDAGLQAWPGSLIGGVRDGPARTSRSWQPCIINNTLCFLCCNFTTCFALGGTGIGGLKMGGKSVIRQISNLAGLMILKSVTAFIVRRVRERRLLAPTCRSDSPSVHIYLHASHWTGLI